MKVIEGGKGKRPPRDAELQEMQAAAMRAQEFARRAIVRFFMSEAEAHPGRNGALMAIGMQAGFLMSVIEAGFIALRSHRAHYDKDYFVGLAGSVFDDVANRDDDDD